MIKRKSKGLEKKSIEKIKNARIVYSIRSEKYGLALKERFKGDTTRYLNVEKDEKLFA